MGDEPVFDRRSVGPNRPFPHLPTAKLPAELDPEHEDAKRFDVLLLNAQLDVLQGDPFERQRRKIMAIAGALEDQDVQ